ncbi:MAG: hypothetical protein IJC02_01945 [Lachnospiraceae bacterium]|nr:hypothetical protein [Lachnospiraceae bacterium]
MYSNDNRSTFEEMKGFDESRKECELKIEAHKASGECTGDDCKVCEKLRQEKRTYDPTLP